MITDLSLDGKVRESVDTRLEEVSSILTTTYLLKKTKTTNMKIIQNGSDFSFADVTAVNDELPKGVYILKQNPMTKQYFLSKKEDFVLPKKIYGDHSIVKRWLTSFENNSEKNLGIILSGLKGSGKTITAQKFCMESKLPVILITESFCGPDFIDFLTNGLLGKCIIFIDEFEKVYDRKDEAVDLLSLMDGNFPTKLIFLLTVNEFRISEFLVNRLNRIKYRKHYSDLEEEIIDEVIEDLLINKDHKQSIYDFFERVNMRTFDLLVNVIKDMNLFNEDAIACGKHLNLEATSKYYDVYEIVDDEVIACNSCYANRAAREFQVERKTLKRKKDEYYVEIDLDDENWEMIREGRVFRLVNKKLKTEFKFNESRTSLVF